MGFVDKYELLKQSHEAERKISKNNIGLVSWKYHSFLKPEENRELQELNYLNIQQAINEYIGTAEDQLVVRNTMFDLDYEHVNGQYRINRNVDSDRKVSIIYGAGCLDGIVPNKINVNVEGVNKEYTSWGIEYFHFFDPMIVVNRRDEATISFDKAANYKLYGMTSESLGAHVCG